MKIARLLVFTATSLFCTLSSTAQGPDKYLKEANELFLSELYAAAAEKYLAAEPKVSGLEDKGFVLFRIAECYRLSYQAAKAEQWYDKAAVAQYYNTEPLVHYNWGLVLQEQGKWEDAAAQFQKYSERGGNKAKADEAIKGTETAADKASQTKHDVVVENVSEFNTKNFDYAPMWADKSEESIIFTSARPEGVGSGSETIFEGENYTDLFITVADKKGKFDTPKPLNATVNTDGNEGVATFDEKYKLMYFTRCAVNNNGRFGCDIFTSKRSGDNYEAAERLVIIPRDEEEGADDSTRIGHPTLTDDEKYMIFASNMAGGKGGRDLWYMTFDKKSETWSKPANMSALNTAGDEMFPYVAMRGGKEILFYSSTKPGGLGGLDIYKAERSGDLTFGASTGLAYPINSSSDDFGIIYHDEKKKPNAGYFSSNRPNGRGGDDIYRFDEPPVVICFKGTVYDKKTATPLAGVTVTVVVAPEGKQYNLTTDGNGGFSLCTNELKNKDILSVSLSKAEYLAPPQDKVNIGEGKSRTITREYFMDPVLKDVEYRLPLVQYPYDKDILLINDTVNSADSLNYLYEVLLANPTFKIQLEAHTDFRGKDPYNLDLSQRRANTCVTYLIQKGIDPGRLVPKGVGEGTPAVLVQPLGPLPAGTKLTESVINKLPAEFQEAAHQINRRTVFKVLSTDFKPKP